MQRTADITQRGEETGVKHSPSRLSEKGKSSHSYKKNRGSSTAAGELRDRGVGCDSVGSKVINHSAGRMFARHCDV